LCTANTGLGVIRPPNDKAAFALPAPSPSPILNKFPAPLDHTQVVYGTISFLVYSSVKFDKLGLFPPNANPASCEPADPNWNLPVIILQPLTQFIPFHSSVAVVVVDDGVQFLPPNITAAVIVPVPAILLFISDRLLHADQDVPSYPSTHETY
jgi:hypothetical protein